MPHIKATARVGAQPTAQHEHTITLTPNGNELNATDIAVAFKLGLHK